MPSICGFFGKMAKKGVFNTPLHDCIIGTLQQWQNFDAFAHPAKGGAYIFAIGKIL
jgi:hypothetical protein